MEPPASRPRSRRGLGPRSLTARLVSFIVVLVIVLVGAIGTATYFSLRSFLLDRFDQQLSSAAAQNGPFYSRCLTEGSGNCYPYGPAPTEHEWVALLGSTGTAVGTVRGPGVTSLVLPASLRSSLVAHPMQRRTFTYGASELRIIASPTRIGVVVITGLSTYEVERTLHRLVFIELVIGLGAIVLALVATSYGVRFSLRRLRRVTTTANEVAAELSPTGTGLERRVDVPDDGSEVGQLAESMNTLLSAVETQFAARLESEARLRQFLADASHELRTPLTSIRGYAELARMQKAAGANADDNLSRIESEGTRMSRLVEDLLTLARSDQPADAEPKRELVDAAELVDEAVSGTRAAFAGREIRAEASTELHVIGDHDQLLRAVRNLVANAAAHTDADRPIVVRGLLDGADIVIQVIDGGPGLPPDEAAHVFERFWRADKARSRARGGSGLGLSIVASIIAAHGGTVRFDSSVEYGSTVTVRLPAVAS